jgi:hypothetical protein
MQGDAVDLELKFEILQEDTRRLQAFGPEREGVCEKYCRYCTKGENLLFVQ